MASWDLHLIDVALFSDDAACALHVDSSAVHGVGSLRPAFCATSDDVYSSRLCLPGLSVFVLYL